MAKEVKEVINYIVIAKICEILLPPDTPKMMSKFSVSHFMFVGEPIVVLNTTKHLISKNSKHRINTKKEVKKCRM